MRRRSKVEKQTGQNEARRQPRISSESRGSKLSLRSLKRVLNSRRSETKLTGSSQRQEQAQAERHCVPAVVWMEYVFPFLDRSSQDNLASAHRDVAMARRSAFHQQEMGWPSGCLKKLSRPIKKVVFSPDNSTLLVTCCKRKVLQYDKLYGPKAPIRGHSGVIADMQFSPTDTSILATASRNDGTLRLWKQRKTQDGETEYDCFRSLLVYQHDLRHMMWSPRGDRVATWGMDCFVRVSDCETGAIQSQHWKTRLEVAGCLETVAFEPPNGSTVAFAQDNDQVLLWNVETDSLRNLPELYDRHGSYRGSFVTSLAYSPDGRYFVVGCHVAMIAFWNVVSGSREQSPSSEEETEEGKSEDSNDSGYVFSKEIHLGGGWSAVTLLEFTPDGRFLACSNHGKQIRIVDTQTDLILVTLNGHSARIESLCFTPDGRSLASCSCDRTIRLWDTSSCCCETASSTLK